MMRRVKFLFTALLLLVLGRWVAFWGLHSWTEQPPPVKAIWVTRYDFQTPHDVCRIIDNVATNGFTDLFFQVRGNGTVCYESELEPWAYELSGWKIENIGKDPGWDPLQLAVTRARMYGIRLHAYMNVLPGWQGTREPPPDSGQLWVDHHDWFMVDPYGKTMSSAAGWYAFLNPAHPEVRRHLRGLARELSAYDIDGIHLDYIRYPYDYYMWVGKLYPKASYKECRKLATFSYDPVSLAQIRARYGKDATNAEIADFRRETVTQVVKDISSELRARKGTQATLSACVLGNVVDGYRYAYQSTRRWMRSGMVDWVIHMNYSTKNYARFLRDMYKDVGRKRFRHGVVVGLLCEHETEALLEQIDLAEKKRCRGIAFFAYRQLFEAHELNEKGRALIERMQAFGAQR